MRDVLTNSENRDLYSNIFRVSVTSAPNDKKTHKIKCEFTPVTHLK